VKRLLIMLVLIGCLVVALAAVASASGGESGGIRPAMLTTNR